MPVMGPCECPVQVDKAFREVMKMLREKYRIQDCPVTGKFPDWKTERKKRNAVMKEAVRLLFQMQSWEDF
jgi:hypothetical protein